MIELGFPILSALIFLPMIGSAAVLAIRGAGEKVIRYFTLAVSLMVLILALLAYSPVLQSGVGAEFNYVEGPITWLPSLGGLDYLLGMDGMSAVLVLLTAFLSVLVILGSWDLIKERQAAYYFLILLFEGAMMGVFTSLNLVLFYVFWELVLIPMFFFIGIWGGPRRKFAAMKFLIYTHVGSTIMLLGFIALFLFSPSHSFNFTDLAGQIPFWLQLVAMAAVFWGFAVKLPVVPFHTWLPDAHVEAPAPISVFLAGLLLKMGGYGFLRFNLGLFPDASREFASFFIILGIITMFYGAFVAMTQKDLKRMIALTSVNHMGFVLLGAFTGSVIGISGAIFQMFNHGIAIGLLFMLSGYIHEQAGTRDITLLKGLRKNMPRTAALLVIGSLAAMGASLYSNFLSEFMVIVGAISTDVRYAVLMLVPLMTVAYFLWMIRRSVTSQPTEIRKHDLGNRSTLALVMYIIPLILLIIFPFLVLNVVDPLATVYANSFLGVTP